MPTNLDKFFDVSGKKPAIITLLGGTDEPLDKMYSRWLEWQVLDTQFRKKCLDHFGILTRQQKKKTPGFVDKDWIDLKSLRFAIPHDFDQIVPRDVTRKTAWAILEAYNQLVMLLRAKILHARRQNEIDENRWKTLEAQLCYKLHLLKVQFKGCGMSQLFLFDLSHSPCNEALVQ